MADRGVLRCSSLVLSLMNRLLKLPKLSACCVFNRTKQGRGEAEIEWRYRTNRHRLRALDCRNHQMGRRGRSESADRSSNALLHRALVYGSSLSCRRVPSLLRQGSEPSGPCAIEPPRLIFASSAKPTVRSYPTVTACPYFENQLQAAVLVFARWLAWCFSGRAENMFANAVARSTSRPGL